MRQILIFSFVFVLLFSWQASAGQVKQVNADQARKLIGERDNLFLLDVRSTAEFAQVRIENARLIPINDLVARITEIPKDRPILVYCAVGSRSSQVTNYLSRAGYPEVFNLSGGIWAWQLRGYPVLKGLP